MSDRKCFTAPSKKERKRARPGSTVPSPSRWSNRAKNSCVSSRAVSSSRPSPRRKRNTGVQYASHNSPSDARASDESPRARKTRVQRVGAKAPGCELGSISSSRRVAFELGAQITRECAAVFQGHIQDEPFVTRAQRDRLVQELAAHSFAQRQPRVVVEFSGQLPLDTLMLHRRSAGVVLQIVGFSCHRNLVLITPGRADEQFTVEVSVLGKVNRKPVARRGRFFAHLDCSYGQRKRRAHG